MSLMPEFIIQTAIVRGIQTFRSDSRFVDQLFRNLSQDSQNKMREFIKHSAIDLNINYPRDTLKVPAIVILLKSESEFQAFLGDSMGTECVPDSMSYDGDVEDEILGGTASVSSLSGQGVLRFGPYRVLSATQNTLKVGSNTWHIDQFRGKNQTLHIVAGTGRGQIRGISGNSLDTIMVSTVWSDVPDSTSVFEIRDAAYETVGSPSGLYDRRSSGFVERRGSIYSVSYQVQVIAENPEITIYLSTLIKSILTLSRLFLEQQGIMDLKMGATDFLPRTEFQPDFTYMRAINLDFRYHFDIFEELGDLAKILQIALETHGPETVVSDSVVDPVGAPETVISGP